VGSFVKLMEGVLNFYYYYQDSFSSIKFYLVIVNLILFGFAVLFRIRQQTQPSSEKKKILFVTAHPDDECMFFTPIIKNLVVNNELYILCLSNGNFEGLGSKREEELVKSCVILGFKKQNVYCENNSKLQDGFVAWDKELVSSIILEKIKNLNINMIITFDESGISSHPNHIATFEGVENLIKTKRISSEIKAYSLLTTNILRKYIGIFDVLFSVRDEYFYISPDFRDAWNAMFVHRTQLVWFRYLYLFFFTLCLYEYT